MLNWEPVEFFQKGCNMTHFVKSEDEGIFPGHKIFRRHSF